MAVIIVQDSADGVTPTFQAAAAGGDSFPNTGQEFLRVITPSATEVTITADNARECQFGDHPDYDIVSPIGQTQLESGRFSTYRFNSNGHVSLTYSPDVVGVQIAVLRHHLQEKDSV